MIKVLLIPFAALILTINGVHGLENYHYRPYGILLQDLTPPEFPGGKEAFHKFIGDNIKWPKTEIDAQGVVVISFFVEKDGYLSNFRVEKGFNKEFDKEALRVIKKSPRWIPATRNSRPIKSKSSAPISFIITVQ